MGERIHLAKGAIRTMFVTKLKTVTSVVLVLALTLSFGGLLAFAGRQVQEREPQDDARAPKPKETPKQSTSTVGVAPLGKDDLVVHEWGVFTVFTDVKYANANRKEEWGSLPKFFYRQFPKERLVWSPSGWDKPIIYVYAKPTPMRVTVKVDFSEGAPVVWWPAVSSPVEDVFRDGPNPKRLKPFTSLVWTASVGDRTPQNDFPLPADCWVKQARVPGASRLTVTGDIETPIHKWGLGKFRSETEGFLYYDGLVPAPDYLRCEKIDGKSVTLRNRAKFDIKRLFVVDRRAKETVALAFVDGTKQSFKAGASVKLELRPIAAGDWPKAGVRQVRQALLDAGLFAPEADALLKIWEKGFFQAKGVTAFHILPAAEYDRMLPLTVLPEPADKPVRVGIALHPHIEIEPVLVDRIGELILQLDTEKRLTAQKTLLELGPIAVSMLQAELKKGPSAEKERRIRAVLEQVDASSWLNLPAQGEPKK